MNNDVVAPTGPTRRLSPHEALRLGLLFGRVAGVASFHNDVDLADECEAVTPLLCRWSAAPAPSVVPPEVAAHLLTLATVGAAFLHRLDVRAAHGDDLADLAVSLERRWTPSDH